ncbi:hypothetical protein BO78DRAFT_245881 [Aspergillus sclerotiicarbonarius CBS 121057]|uniref:Zn(2)-C6 fungal-type domain-containing protein n=1 Tax=Aspergillus sclerotiicarbonarius (strain CBS 121057 / IBT 28362) TaxID=1448318 RepID=A0A319DUX6_ASPSB|nr:hypothetical protein BO78DRAFT_245881 [Aspergillus sclerotiicarbonarius CBS 121057]
MAETPAKPLSFACQSCRTSKRRCDGLKPECSTCKDGNKSCIYITEPKKRKRKYWDEQYVKSLENQVQALLANQSKNDVHSLSGTSSGSARDSHPSQEQPASAGQGQRDTSPSQSLQAMEELSVMMWRTNLADGVAIDRDNGPDPISMAMVNQSQAPRYPPHHFPDCCRDHDRMYEIARLFLENINGEHQFTQYRTPDPILEFPEQRTDLVFLHAAILAAGATFEHRPDSHHVSDEFACLCESLVFTCFRTAPSIYIIQGLCILSWRSLALGHDHLGWTFLSMAAGMAVHLRLHVLALDEMATNHVRPSSESVQTFWSFYMTDRTSISILGRNCMLPWRRVNVPPIDDVYQNQEADLGQISFAWQCKLWYTHDQNMDQIFSSSFEGLSLADQVHLLSSIHEGLRVFFKSRDERLVIKAGGVTPKPVLLFHMAYQMAVLVTMPPFLRLFATAKTEKQKISQAMPLVLQSLTSAAACMVRHVQNYCKWYGFKHSNPLLIHHLLSASIVHLMNTTTTSIPFRRYSTRSVRSCVNLLHKLGRHWQLRSEKSIKVIKTLARRWNVESTVLYDNGSELDRLAEDEQAPAFQAPAQDFGESFNFLYEQQSTNEQAQQDIDQQNYFPDMGLGALDYEFLGLSQIFSDFGNGSDLSWDFGG